MRRALFGGLLSMAAVFGFVAVGQERPQPSQQSNQKKVEIKTAKVFRVGDITGTNVHNLEGEKVGTIDELVIDVEKGQVVYAAMSVGGFLGLGDKLFAVPWREFTLEFDEKDKFFRVDITKERLEKAEGFDKDAWPNVADPKWRERIESQYRESNRNRDRATTTRTRTTVEKEVDR